MSLPAAADQSVFKTTSSLKKGLESQSIKETPLRLPSVLVASPAVAAEPERLRSSGDNEQVDVSDRQENPYSGGVSAACYLPNLFNRHPLKAGT